MLPVVSVRVIAKPAPALAGPVSAETTRSGKATPVPDSGTFFGFSSVSFEAKLKVATLEPREVGVRRTVTCQVAAGARLNAPPPAMIEYSAVPRSVVEVTFRVAVPVLRTVTARSLNEPWATLPKESDAGAVSMSGVESTAPPTYRASANSARPLTVAPPATTIFPSGCTATEDGTSLAPAKSVVTLPLVPKLVSSVPLLLKRARATLLKPPTRVRPTTTIFPSDCRATADGSEGTSSAPAKSVVTLPLVPKLVSSVPLVL